MSNWRTSINGCLLVLLAAGIGVWGSLLLAPEPGSMPAAFSTSTRQGVDTAPLAQWLGGGSRLRVTVAGLMRSTEQGAALLTVNGSTPRAYRIGESLAPGVILADVQTDSVLLDQDGVTERLPAPQHATPASGLRPAGVRPIVQRTR